jgi:Mn-dependent DtxR family transcriptional regulator
MKPVIIGLGDDVDENARRFMKVLGLSDEEIERRINERNHVKSEEEVLEGFRNFFDD